MDSAPVAPAPTRWLRIIRSKTLWIPAIVAAANLALALYVEFVPIQNFPNSADEYAYLISAEIFARGKLSVPSPSLPTFFDVMHVVNDGKFYGKYPPGWALLLAPGVLLHVVWLINPLIGALTVFAVHRLATRHFSVEIANVSALLFLGNPFVVFNCASYFSHPACLLFATGFLHYLFTCVSAPGDRAAFLKMGACAGAAFVIRPFTVVVLLAIPSVYLLLQAGDPARRKALLQGLGLALAPFAVFLALFLAYNRAQTGNAFRQPFEMYAPWDVPGVPKDAGEWKTRWSTHVLDRTWDLNRWLPLAPVLVVLACLLTPSRSDPKIRVMALSFAALFTAFFFYWGEGGFQYGPRYLYEATAFILLLSAAVIVRYPELGALILLSVYLVGTTTFLSAIPEVSEQVTLKKDVYRTAEENGLSNAIVFLRSGSGSAPLWDCPRNGIDFNPPVLYVRDQGPSNRLLLKEYPGRKAYYYEYDATARKGSLAPVEPSMLQR